MMVIVYQSHGDFDKTVAVTSIVDDGNRYFERDDEIEDSSFKATDRGTLVHLFLELFPLEKNLNFEKAFEKTLQRDVFNEDAKKLIK